MEVLKTSRGGDKICYEGYMYTKRDTKKTRIRWECTQRKSRPCKGAITTSLTLDDVRVTVAHSHDNDNSSVEAEKLRCNIREKAKASRESTACLLATAIQEAPESVRLRLGNQESVKRNIRRQRQGSLPKDPVSLRELHVPEEWSTTGGEHPQPFLIHDSGPQSSNRVLVFAADNVLQHLASADKWYMDGNFSVAPNIFMQLYVIRVPLGNSAISAVYGLLPNKQQRSYEAVIKATLDRCEELGFTPDPTVIVTDFETSAMNAVQVTLGHHVRTQGCFYHLTQSTWRKIQDLGLVQKYRNEEEIKHFVGMLDGLAFLPLADVEEGMALLKNATPEGLEELVDYFDSTYVSGSISRVQPSQNNALTLQLRRRPPLFPPQTWNVHDVTLTGGDRTNNMCESWNHAFSHLVGHKHPSLWTLIDSLRKDYALVSLALLQQDCGQPPKKRVKRSTKLHQERLYEICIARRDGQKTIEQTLKAMGYCIRP